MFREMHAAPPSDDLVALVASDKGGVAEIVAAIPERHMRAHGGAEMVDRLQLGAGNAIGKDRRSMVMTDRFDVGASLVDAAVNDHFAVETHVGRGYGLCVKREFENVRRLN